MINLSSPGAIVLQSLLLKRLWINLVDKSCLELYKLSPHLSREGSLSRARNLLSIFFAEQLGEMTSPAFVSSTALRTSGLTHVCGQTCGQRSELNITSIAPRKPEYKRGIVMAAERKFLVGGNWKCNLNKSSIKELCAAFNEGPSLDPESVEVVVAPPAPYLESTREILRKDFAVSAQNVWISKGGAFTGETDAAMVQDVGAGWTILGHSERRHLPELKETDETISKKAAYTLKETNLKVIYCIGELLEEREAGQTLAICQRQLSALSAAIDDWSKVVIAYEPVWAIGTGKVATPEQAEEVHLDVRKWLADNVSKKVADETRILYGGSVSPGNCQDLAKKPNVDGFLVGGASLKPSFLEVIDSYKAAMPSAV